MKMGTIRLFVSTYAKQGVFIMHLDEPIYKP